MNIGENMTHTLLAAKEQSIGAILAFAMACLFAADIMAVRFTKTVIDATMCAIIAYLFVTFSTSPD